MHSYLTPEETAQQLRIEVPDVMSLIEQGKLRAIRIGDNIRIRETELERLEITCAAAPTAVDAPDASLTIDAMKLPAGQRWIVTRTGRAKFRALGSAAAGVEIWPGRMQYPIKFPKEFMEALLARFRDEEVPVGGKFDDPVSCGIAHRGGIRRSRTPWLHSLPLTKRPSFTSCNR